MLKQPKMFANNILKQPNNIFIQKFCVGIIIGYFIGMLLYRIKFINPPNNYYIIWKGKKGEHMFNKCPIIFNIFNTNVIFDFTLFNFLSLQYTTPKNKYIKTNYGNLKVKILNPSTYCFEYLIDLCNLHPQCLSSNNFILNDSDITSINNFISDLYNIYSIMVVSFETIAKNEFNKFDTSDIIANNLLREQIVPSINSYLNMYLKYGLKLEFSSTSLKSSFKDSYEKKKSEMISMQFKKEGDEYVICGLLKY